jgi:hypothetical protein
VAKHESFLVRVWWRARSGEGQWVGRLEHLQERAVQNFHDPEELLAHLRSVLMPHEGADQGGEEPPYSVVEPLDAVKETDRDDLTGPLVSPKTSVKGEEPRTSPHAQAEMVHNAQ